MKNPFLLKTLLAIVMMLASFSVVNAQERIRSHTSKKKEPSKVETKPRLSSTNEIGNAIPPAETKNISAEEFRSFSPEKQEFVKSNPQFYNVQVNSSEVRHTPGIPAAIFPGVPEKQLDVKTSQPEARVRNSENNQASQESKIVLSKKEYDNSSPERRAHIDSNLDLYIIK